MTIAVRVAMATVVLLSGGRKKSAEKYLSRKEPQIADISPPRKLETSPARLDFDFNSFLVACGYVISYFFLIYNAHNTLPICSSGRLQVALNSSWIC